MSEAEKKGLHSYYFLCGGILSLIPLASRCYFVGAETLPSSLIFVLSCVSLGLVVDFVRLKKEMMAINFLLVSIFLYGFRHFLELSGRGASSFSTALAVVAVSSPVLLVLPLLGKLGLKKSLVSSISLVYACLCYFAVRYYLVTYLYLYEPVGNLGQYESISWILFMMIVVVMVGELFLKGERIYSGYVLLFLISLGYLGLDAYKSSEVINLASILVGVQDLSQVIWILLIFIIYIGVEKPEELKIERRNVVFSNMVYEELKPIQKKKKALKFEIPPNVPKKREYKEENEDYIQ